MSEIIKPENDSLLLNLTTTEATPTNYVLTDEACDNKNHQFTNTVIYEVSGNLLK